MLAIFHPKKNESVVRPLNELSFPSNTFANRLNTGFSGKNLTRIIKPNNSNKPVTKIYRGNLFLTKNKFMSDQNKKNSENARPNKTPKENERMRGSVTNTIFENGCVGFKSNTFK
jgi:hypothetical protein